MINYRYQLWTLSGNAIWRARPMFNLMLETIMEWSEQLDGPGTTNRVKAFTLSPGARGGWNIGYHQLILGLAIPVTWSGGGNGHRRVRVPVYELPFRKYGAERCSAPRAPLSTGTHEHP